MFTNKLELVVDKISDDVLSLHNSLDDIEKMLNDLLNELQNLDTSGVPTDTPPLNATPYMLQKGPLKGYTALQWPSGGFVHNDWSLDPESVVGTYEFHGIKKENRIHY